MLGIFAGLERKFNQMKEVVKHTTVAETDVDR